jgi:hypothetical protein
MDETTAVLDARAPRWRRPDWFWIAVSAAIAVGVAVIVMVVLASGARDATTAGDPADARAAALGGAASAGLAAAIEQGDALAASTSAAQLADPTAYSDLLGALAAARSVQAAGTGQAEPARSNLADAIDRVLRSQSAKALSDARSDLSAVLATAVDVVAEMQGRIADESLRTQLQSGIDAGTALIASPVATVGDVAAGAQTITDQTAAVLAARLLGFREAQGGWCATADDCLVIDWPNATLANGDVIALDGGDQTLSDSECSETDTFRTGRDAASFLYCPAGAAIPDGRRATGGTVGDESVDRLWLVSGNRLSDLRQRAA